MITVILSGVSELCERTESKDLPIPAVQDNKGTASSSKIGM